MCGGVTGIQSLNTIDYLALRWLGRQPLGGEGGREEPVFVRRVFALQSAEKRGRRGEKACYIEEPVSKSCCIHTETETDTDTATPTDIYTHARTHARTRTFTLIHAHSHAHTH